MDAFLIDPFLFFHHYATCSHGDFWYRHVRFVNMSAIFNSSSHVIDGAWAACAQLWLSYCDYVQAVHPGTNVKNSRYTTNRVNRIVWWPPWNCWNAWIRIIFCLKTNFVCWLKKTILSWLQRLRHDSQRCSLHLALAMCLKWLLFVGFPCKIYSWLNLNL